MKKFTFSSTLILLFLSTNAVAKTTDYKSALRQPNENWEDSYQRHIQGYETAKGVRPPKNAQEAAVKIDKLDTSVTTEWGKNIDLVTTFFNLRDIRFLQTEDNPSFLRRISWLYPDDGCFARAAMMVAKLRETNIAVPSKVYIFGNLKVKTQNSPSGEVGWWFHVAPAVRIAGQVYILDPAINPYQPLPLVDWVKTMTDEPQRVKLSICKGDSYIPSDSCFEPQPSDADDGPTDQVKYLDDEWERSIDLDRNPQEVLGDNPPWKGK